MSPARSNTKGVILFLSNGQGEDLIAATVIERLLREDFAWEVRALPLVGEGKAYSGIGIKLLATCRMMPSGGFAGFNLFWWAKDVASGWLGIFKEQIDILKKERAITDIVVCVGDVFPVLLSVLFLKKPIIFLPTAKSDYARFFKDHYRIEKWLMRRFCGLVLPRDKLTASSLKRFGVNAIYIGNVMMDCLKISGERFGIEEDRYVVGILPGSKEEAYRNLPIILEAVKIINAKPFLSGKVDFLLALASSLNLERLGQVASSRKNWILENSIGEERKKGIVACLVSSSGIRIKIVQGKFGDVLNSSKVIIGLSGMGNEQAVGLGKAVVSFPTRGPQITKNFLYIQRLILGGAISIVEPSAEAVAEEVVTVLSHPEERERVLRIGKERMGNPGAAARVADLIKRELNKCFPQRSQR